MTKKTLLDHIAKYVNVTVGELREDFFITTRTFSAVRWRNNCIYVPLPDEFTSVLSELLNDGRLEVVVVRSEQAVLHEEGLNDFVLAHQPAGAKLEVDGNSRSFENKYVTLKFRLPRK